ncbi:MAG: YvcK family protein [Burkholderiales bacterium]|nr:YvcK family protein [Anaerolineae bacterium]
MIDGRAITKWLTPGIGVKRWLMLLILGILLVAFAIAFLLFELRGLHLIEAIIVQSNWLVALLAFGGGLALIIVALLRLSTNILAPYRNYQQRNVVDAVYSHSKRHKGMKVVAIGGGTGLPSVIRGLKSLTSNITVVVTVADDGGSSGRLRREQGVLPPGDLRQNIAALADDESLITQLFQYRFENGDLGGHSFGNLFITAMAGVTGSLEQALIETERVLNIQGRVLPSTLEDIRLVAEIIPPGKTRSLTIRGESKITEVGGKIERIAIEPAEAVAYSESVRAIREADIVVIGPGSLYTSILPNLLVRDIKESVRATNAYKIYVCNVAIQPGETDGYSVADHVMALEQHIGRGVFQAVLANNAYPTLNAGDTTHYVLPSTEHHEIAQRYEVRYTDLTDEERPWRHDPRKLAKAIINLSEAARVRTNRAEPIPV